MQCTAQTGFASIRLRLPAAAQYASAFALLALLAAPTHASERIHIGGHPKTTVAAGAEYEFRPWLSAPQSMRPQVRWAIRNQPWWAHFDASTGELSGKVDLNELGTYRDISISASDGNVHASMSSFSIRVTAQPPGDPGPVRPTPPASAAPTISGTPASSVAAGSTYLFKPVASDASGARLTFSIKDSPSWAIFNTATGQLSGTPTASVAGTTPDIVISVSDGKASASLAPFSITVTAAVAARSGPKISGTPAAAARVGSAYSFQPAASDTSGAKLSFSISKAPSWANFNTATGLLAGTPPAAAVGTTSNIVISVSDGNSSASLPPFAITVTQPGSLVRTATLSWTPPTQNQDGSALTNLAGYIISWGTSAGALTNTITVSNAAANSYTVGNLTAGTWYFDIRAYNNLGTDSPLSSVVSTVLQ